MNISSLHHFFTSSSHSLFGRPLFVFSFISPNTTSFIPVCYLPLYRFVQISSISSPCFSVRCFFCYSFFFLFLEISSLVIFCCHLTFRILRYISSHLKCHQFVLVFFRQRPRFTCVYNADYAGCHNVSFGLYAIYNVFAFPDVLELYHYSCCSS